MQIRNGAITAYNGINDSGSVSVTGSISVSNNITGSNALFSGTITAQTLTVQVITSSIEYITGSTRFGSQLTDTHVFTGSVNITSSLTVLGTLNATSSWAISASWAPSSFPYTGSAKITGSLGITGSLTISGSGIFTQGITGSVFGTASWALNFITGSVTSASYAFTASSAVTASNFSGTGSNGFVSNMSDTYTSTAKITDIISLTAAEYSGIGAPSTSTLYIII